MQTLDFGVSNEYNIRFSTSPVFECALDIAAFTREEIYDKLDRNLDDLRSMRDGMSTQLLAEVRLAGEVHTWRTLLFLAHRCSELSQSPWEQHLDIFVKWIEEHEDCLIELAAPYLGEVHEVELQDALSGDRNQAEHLIEIYSDNPIVHLNLRYLFSVDSSALLQHLKTLLTGWYKESVPKMSLTMLGIWQDREHNEQLVRKMKAAELIRLITRGGELQPHPGVDTLWLIPQFAYRPFTIINYLPNCVVYYYPMSEEFLPGGIAQTQLNQVATLHKALGDVQRIRLLTLVRHSPKSLAELTGALNGTKSNIHHHLTLLRTAGLVQVVDGVYSLNQDAVARVGTELQVLLGIQK